MDREETIKHITEMLKWFRIKQYSWLVDEDFEALNIVLYELKRIPKYKSEKELEGNFKG